MERASLAGMPQELFDDVCSHLSQHTLTKLARASKTINRKVQNPLYYHCVVRDFRRLALFVRTMSDAAQCDRRGDVFSKNLYDLRLILDPSVEEGNRATAVVLGRMISSVARYCPKIRTHLVLKNATCNSQPISSFSIETFPRVISLILHTSEGVRASGSQRQRTQAVVYNSRVARMGHHRDGSNTSCRPRAEFWTGIFNGTSFPHLEEVEIIHERSGFFYSDVVIEAGELKGLQNIRRLAVKWAPELNSSVLTSALRCAPNLTHLELKFISGLEYSDLTKLIQFALPNLKNFTLWVWPDHDSARKHREDLRYVDPLQPSNPAGKPVHLCPLFRDFGKNTPHFDIFLPFVCRELFLTVAERIKIADADISFTVGTRDGGKSPVDKLDAAAIAAVVKEHRKLVEQARFQAAVKENMAAARKEGKDKLVTLAEYDVNQTNLKRERTIKSEKWKRTVRCGKRLCRSYESWEEMGVLAGLEEKNTTWVLGHERLDTAAVFTGGSPFPTGEKSYDQQFPMQNDSDCAARITALRVGGRDHGIDFNEHAH